MFTITYAGASVAYPKEEDKAEAFNALRELITLVGQQRSSTVHPTLSASKAGPIESEYLRLTNTKFMKLTRDQKENGVDREQVAQARIDSLGQSGSLDVTPTETCDGEGLDVDHVIA